MPEIRLLTLDPGHFHAALVQKEMTPETPSEIRVTWVEPKNRTGE